MIFNLQLLNEADPVEDKLDEKESKKDENDNEEEELKPNETDNEENENDIEIDDEDEDSNSIDFDNDFDDNSNNNNDGGSLDNDDNVVGDENKEAEKELFNDLTPSQLKVRDRELLKNYKDLYEVVDTMISRVTNYLSITNNNKECTYIINKLNEIQKYLSDYIIELYKSKSYVENITTYYEFIAITNSMNDMIDKLSHTEGKED